MTYVTKLHAGHAEPVNDRDSTAAKFTVQGSLDRFTVQRSLCMNKQLRQKSLTRKTAQHMTWSTCHHVYRLAGPTHETRLRAFPRVEAIWHVCCTTGKSAKLRSSSYSYRLLRIAMRSNPIRFPVQYIVHVTPMLLR